MLIIEGGQEAKVHGVRVLNHCVFCFTKLCNGREEERLHPGTVRKYVRKTSTLEMLERKVESKSTETKPSPPVLTEFPTAELNRVWREVVQKSYGAPLTFPKTPPICFTCGMLLQHVLEKLKQLKKSINIFRSAMKPCGKDGSKAEEKFFTFLRHLKEAQVEDGSRRATLNFMEKIGHGEMKEEDYQKWFPNLSKAEITTPTEIIQVDKLPPPSADSPEPSIPLQDPLSGQSSGCGVPVSGPAKCDICNKKVEREGLKGHVRSHIGDLTLSCPNPECPFACASLPRLKSHVTRARVCSKFLTNNLSQCSVCDCKFKNLRLLNHHLRTTHQEGLKQIRCPFPDCLSKFSNRQSAQLHISYIHVKLGKVNFLAPPSFQKCPECRKDVHQERIKLHLETFHKIPQESQISCNHCPHVFSSHEQLLDHLTLHTKTDTPVTCHLCSQNKKYLKVSLLREHCFKDHQIGTSFVCEHCSTEVYTLKALRAHVEVHSGKASRKKSQTKIFNCEECQDDQSYTQNTLISHRITRRHGAEPVLRSCQYCEEIFITLQGLKVHENEHKGVVRNKVKHICDLPGCGKAYGSPKALQRHKMSVEHLGKIEAFICDDSGKGYNTEESLKSHHKLVHIAERKFICEDCGESFKLNEVLKQHKLIHTGERSFECPYCRQRFRSKENLKVHVDSHKREGADFKPNGPMAKIRKRVNPK